MRRLPDDHTAVKMEPGTNAYKLIHDWINTHYPRNGRCEYCGTTKRPTHYATARRGRYSRNRADWFEFCVPCHSRFDGNTGINPQKIRRGEDNGRAKLAETDVREIRRLRAEGRTIVSLGEQFDVSHVLISRIARRAAWSHIL